MKWFVYYDINSTWKNHMYIKANPFAADPKVQLVHWFVSFHVTICWFIVWIVQRIPTRERGVHLPLLHCCAGCPDLFPPSLWSFFHNTGHCCTYPILMPILSQSQLSCSDLYCACTQATHCQCVLVSPGVLLSAGIILYVFTIFFYTYQFHQTGLEPFCIGSKPGVFRDYIFTPWRHFSVENFDDVGKLVSSGDKNLNCWLNIMGQKSGRGCYQIHQKQLSAGENVRNRIAWVLSGHFI